MFTKNLPYYQFINTLILFFFITCCQAKNKNDEINNNHANVTSQSVETFSPYLALQEITPLTITGPDFTNSNGRKVRFWGVNLTSFYPTHKIADKTAENLADLGVNLVRPHHLMRPSRDWNPQMQSGALVTYKNNSLEFDEEALDKFDYLNSALKDKGIYLALALRWSRTYHEGDVSIIKTTPEDEELWSSAWKEIKSWHWQKQHDVIKSLSLIDERFIAIDEAFATQLLTHKNPYTQVSYAQDPQVATLEIINEYGAEYTFICNNKFPPYFHKKLQKKWSDFAIKQGITANDFYSPQGNKERILRLDFLINLDAQRMQRMTKITRNLGYQGAITYSNLFRGENHLALHDKLANHMEDHIYADPFVVDKKEDLFYEKSKTMLQNKPFIISEFNVTENKELRQKHQNKRTMLTAATVAYASFHNWSGITWFSWQHGTSKVGKNGWSVYPDRTISLGDMVKDEMQLDHFKTASIIFRNGYIQQATPKTMFIDSPYKYDEYHKLMAGKYQFKKGWQNIHSIRKTFTPTAPEKMEAQHSSNWMTQEAKSPLVSDTGQIIKDTERKQLTASADKAEVFTGYLDNTPPAGLTFMNISKDHGFATIMVTSLTNEKLVNSNAFLISRTYVEESNFWFFSSEGETDNLPITLNTNKANSKWQMKVTRPFKQRKSFELTADSSGVLELPKIRWYQAELTHITLHK